MQLPHWASLGHRFAPSRGDCKFHGKQSQCNGAHLQDVDTPAEQISQVSSSMRRSRTAISRVTRISKRGLHTFLLPCKDSVDPSIMSKHSRVSLSFEYRIPHQMIQILWNPGLQSLHTSSASSSAYFLHSSLIPKTDPIPNINEIFCIRSDQSRRDRRMKTMKVDRYPSSVDLHANADMIDSLLVFPMYRTKARSILKASLSV